MGTIRPSLNGLYSLLIHSGDAGSHLYWQEGNEGVPGGACPSRSRLLPDQGDCRPGALSVPPCVWTATVRNPAPLFLWDSQFLVCLGWPAEVRTGGWPAGVRACRSLGVSVTPSMETRTDTGNPVASAQCTRMVSDSLRLAVPGSCPGVRLRVRMGVIRVWSVVGVVPDDSSGSGSDCSLY